MKVQEYVRERGGVVGKGRDTVTEAVVGFAKGC